MAFLPDVLQHSRYVQQVQSFVTKCMNDWSMTLAGALAYSLLLSTIPIIAALLSILGLLLGNLGYDTLARVTQAITSAFPPEVHVAEIVQAIVSDLEQSSGVLGVIAVLSALFFGSRLFLLLEACFAIIYQVRPRSLLPQNVMAVGMMLAFILLVPLMVLSSTFPTWVFSLVPQTFLERFPFFSVLQSFLGGVIPSFLFFELIYVIVPNRHIQLRHGWLGALLAAAARQLLFQFFPF